MKFEDKFATQEQCKKLKELGVIIPFPDFYWVDESAWSKGYQIQYKDNAEYSAKETKNISFTDFETTYPAFTCFELGKALLNNTQIWFDGKAWFCGNINSEANFAGWTMAEVMAMELISILSNKEITSEEINVRIKT